MSPLRFIMKKIIVGISSCLLGEKVRYDGGHKFDHFLAITLGQFFEYYPLCPEVECGLPVPREAMHLVMSDNSIRLLGIKSKTDFTHSMRNWAEQKLKEMENLNLCGFIFKSRSPSSGMERVKIYSENGKLLNKSGVGIFAEMFMKKFPLMPVEEEGRLQDPLLRENFIERVFAYYRWRIFLEEHYSLSGLMDFHASHKLLLMAHSPAHYRDCGRIVASAVKDNLSEVSNSYFEVFMDGLKKIATVSKNCNVLHHLLGYFKKVLTPSEKEEMLYLIEQYRQGFIPLIVPVTMINHYVSKYNEPYLKRQYYLNPHPVELKLRNHA